MTRLRLRDLFALSMLAWTVGGCGSDDSGGASSGSSGDHGSSGGSSGGGGTSSSSGSGDDAAVEASSPTTDASSPDSGGSTSRCLLDSDCRLFNDTCTGCHCLALDTSQADPTCPGPGGDCLVEPCRGKTAACVGGQCVER
jgi:hypothetical protein